MYKNEANATKIKNNKDKYGGVIGRPIRPVKDSPTICNM